MFKSAKNTVSHLLRIGVCLLLIAAAAAGRSGKRFVSVEELAAACPKVSQTHVQQLRELGALGELPDSSQMSLF